MKKQNLNSLKLNKKSISNFNTNTVVGGRKTWLNAECATMTCDLSVDCQPVTQNTCAYRSCVACHG
jgi:hypothetical protein